MSSMEYIRNYYDVPAIKGQDVRWRGETLRIARASGPHLQVQPPKGHSFPLHPKEEGLEYAWYDPLPDLLGLVGIRVTVDEVRAWGYRKAQQAERWAAKTHLRAGDHHVRVPPKPEWLPEPWAWQKEINPVTGKPFEDEVIQ